MNDHGQLDDDTTTMIILAILFGPAALTAGLGVLASQTPAVASWLMNHHILTSHNPVLVIPGTDGAGLDWLRIIPIAALMLIALVWSVWLARSKASSEKVTEGGGRR